MCCLLLCLMHSIIKNCSTGREFCVTVMTIPAKISCLLFMCLYILFLIIYFFHFLKSVSWLMVKQNLLHCLQQYSYKPLPWMSTFTGFVFDLKLKVSCHSPHILSLYCMRLCLTVRRSGLTGPSRCSVCNRTSLYNKASSISIVLSAP